MIIIFFSNQFIRFPEVTVTNDHILGSFNQRNLTSLRSGIKGSRGGSIHPLLLPAPCGHRCSLACSCVNQISALVFTSLSLVSVSQISLCLSLRRTLVIGCRAHLGNSGSSPHLKFLNLITSSKFLLLYNIFIAPRMRIQTSLRGHNSSPTTIHEDLGLV